MIRQRTRWRETPEQWEAFKAECVALYGQGHTVSKIMEHFRTNNKHVTTALREAGVDTSAGQLDRARAQVAARHAAMRDDVLAAWGSDDAMTAIVERLHLGHEHIAQVWREEGLPTRRPWIDARRGGSGQRKAPPAPRVTEREVELEINVLGGVWITLPMVEVSA